MTEPSSMFSPDPMPASDILTGFETLPQEAKPLFAFVFTHMVSLCSEALPTDPDRMSADSFKVQLQACCDADETIRPYAASAVIPKMSEVPPEVTAATLVPSETGSPEEYLTLIILLLLGEIIELKYGADCTALSQDVLKKGDKDGATALILVGCLRRQTSASDVNEFAAQDIVDALKAKLSEEEMKLFSVMLLTVTGVLAGIAADSNKLQSFLKASGCPNEEEFAKARMRTTPLVSVLAACDYRSLAADPQLTARFFPQNLEGARALVDQGMPMVAKAETVLTELSGFAADVFRDALFSATCLAAGLLSLKPQDIRPFMMQDVSPDPLTSSKPHLDLFVELGGRVFNNFSEHAHGQQTDKSDLN